MEKRPQYICYRSFKPQIGQTRDFAAMGIPLRCFFAANTINHGGSPYCDYPVIWKGFGQYDWSALDAQVEDFLNASPKAEFLCMIDLNTPYWATHKFWLDSFTDVTHAASDPEWIGRTKEWMLDFIAGNTREAAFAIANGCSYWWFDMWGGKDSFYEDPALRRRIAKLAEITRALGADMPHPSDEVLLVADPDSIYYLNERFLAVHTKLGGQMTVSLPRMMERVVDLLTDETVAENTDTFTACFSTPDTRLFSLSPRRWRSGPAPRC